MLFKLNAVDVIGVDLEGRFCANKEIRSNGSASAAMKNPFASIIMIITIMIIKLNTFYIFFVQFFERTNSEKNNIFEEEKLLNHEFCALIRHQTNITKKLESPLLP